MSQRRQQGGWENAFVVIDAMEQNTSQPSSMIACVGIVTAGHAPEAGYCCYSEAPCIKNEHALEGPGFLLLGLLFAPASDIKESENQKMKNC